MLRNSKPISIDLAADIQVNTNFIIPQRGNTILRRVNNYRQSQREQSSAQNILIEPQQAVQTKPENKQTGFRTTSAANAKSIIQNSNCRNFMLPDSPRATNYEFSLLPYEDINIQNGRKRPMSTEYRYENPRKNSPKSSLQPKEKQYLIAVKQASQILRKTMVLNYVDTIKKALPIETFKSQVQPPQVVSQERINQALRKSVSKTERELNASARLNKKAQTNSVSPGELNRQDNNNSYSMNTTAVLKQGEGQLGLILQNYIQRPKSMRAGNARKIRKQPSDVLSKEIQLQNVLSETNASTLNTNTRTHANNIQLAFTQKNSNLTTTDLRNTIVQQDQTIVKNVPQQQVHTANTQLSEENIKSIDQLKIFVPSKVESQDDKMMSKFVEFVCKGYVRQAEMCLNAIREDYPGKLFNLGLLSILQNNPEKAVQQLQGYKFAIHNQKFNQNHYNYKIAQRLINQKKVIQDKEENAVVNNIYFKRTYPYGHQKLMNQTIEKDKEVRQKRKLTDWDLFLIQVKRYKQEDYAKFMEDKSYFDKVIRKINHICDRESQLIPNCLTKIKQEEEVDQTDTEQIVTVTQLRDTVLRDAPNLAADKSLEEVFIEMLNIQSTYCVGAKDPIQESFDFLIEGLRSFDEKFNLEIFVNEFLHESAKGNVEDIKALLDRYQSPDRLQMRARTFIMSCFDSEHTQDQKDQSLNVLLRVVREAKEDKLKRMMDPARFQIESLFIHLVDDIITASRNENGPGPLSQDDEYLANRLNFHRELSGRSRDVHLMKIVDYSKLDLENHQLLERAIKKPVNFAKIEPGRVAKEKKIEIQKKLIATWQRHITKPLSKEEYQIVLDQVKKELDEIAKTAESKYNAEKQNAQLRQKQIQDVDDNGFMSVKKANVKRDLTVYIQKKLKQKKKRIEEQQQLKKLDDSDYEVSVDEEEIDPEIEQEILRRKQQQELLEHNLKISSEQVQFGSSMMNIWQDHPDAVSLRQALYKIQLMCEDEKVIFDKDQVRLAPLLEKWGIQAQAEKEIFERSSNDIQTNEETKLLKERPKVGKQVPQSLLKYLMRTLNNIQELFQSEVNKLDDVLVENFRFFSIIDRNVRMLIIKQVELVYFKNKGTLIESDVEETNYVYIVIQGTVDYMLFKHDTNVTVVAATYRAGEVFGDASIQRQYFDVFKCLSKDRKYLETSSDDVYAFRIQKSKFVAAIFAEMRVELMYKILLFRNTAYFKELSPYSLVMFASICEVVDYKYGEIIISQGSIPDACYLIASGQCQAVYHYVENQSTKISQHARKVLQNDVPQPLIKSKADYKNLAKLQARESQIPAAPTKKRKSNKDRNKPANDHQSQSQIDGPQIKRAYFHGILSQDDKKKIIQYENHLPFAEIRQGQVFGARTLLDHLTFNKHVAQNSLRFAEQLGLDEDRWIEELKSSQQKQQQDKIKSQSDLSSTLKMKTKATNYFQEQENKSFDSQTGSKRMMKTTNTITSGNEDKRLNFGTNEINSASFISNDASFVKEFRDQSPIPDFQEANRKLSQKVTSNLGTREQKNPTQQKVSNIYSDEKCHQLFIDHMHENLLRSQTSIIVTSATAKLIVIKKEDKTFLNEALKQSIDRVIIEENFQDHERPLKNFKEVQNTLKEARTWITHRKQLEESFLKEAKFNRTQNKLLD